jgi:hypothetical protein
VISDTLLSPVVGVSEAQAASLKKRVVNIGSFFCFWCGFRATAGLALIFMARDPEREAHWFAAALMTLVFAGASLLGWLVKTQANRTAARLLLLLPLSLAAFIVIGHGAASESRVVWGILFTVGYAAAAIEAIRVTNRVYNLPGVNLVL